MVKKKRPRQLIKNQLPGLLAQETFQPKPLKDPTRNIPHVLQGQENLNDFSQSL